ncbi:YuzB family protein [Salsuginibacillus kocurii]|uniref:YuzB family protein n=1 Tax=Salsuginibacillus kocurii TaxID=427078 RepID=UPI0003773ED8|nr:YuzB family protein [Salsuginibacillus kocurii]
MYPIIEFCMSNLASGTHPVMEELEKDPNVDVVEYGCLAHCAECAENAFALVNGEMVTGETNEELLANIYQFLEENPMI